MSDKSSEFDIKLIIQRIKEFKNLRYDKEVAAVLDVDAGTLSAAKFRGSFPFHDDLVRFCEKEGLDIKQFYRSKILEAKGVRVDIEAKLVKDMVAEPAPANNHEKIKHLRSQVAETIRKTVTHPGIRIWAYAGAGNPFNADPAESEPMEVLHIESLISPRYRDAFRITGISMAPVIRDKALVFCDFEDKVLKTGAIYALNIPGEGLVVKEIRSEKKEGEPMRWVVYSYNEALYKPHYYALDELQEIGAIVGRIVLIHQELQKEGVHIGQ